MGCSNMKAAVTVSENTHSSGPLVNDNNNGVNELNHKTKKKKNVLKERQQGKKLNEANFPPPKPVAFEVNFDAENPFKRPPPPHLSRLAPLENAPKLTHQQLVEKLEQAEIARSQELEKKRTLSRRSSRRRLSILQAKEFEKENQLADVDFDQRVKEEKREQALDAKREKARRQDARRKRVRAKARRMSEAPEEEVASLDFERDMTFNRGDDRDEVDSWLGDSDHENNKTNVNKRREIPRDDSGNYSSTSGPRGSLGENIFSSVQTGFSVQNTGNFHVSKLREERVKILPDDEDFFDS